MIDIPLQNLFQFGTPALYLEASGKQVNCRIFIDIGWRDELSRYESHTPETITIISILLDDVPVPRTRDQIQANGKWYSVMNVHAQDDAIALLYVKEL